MDDTVFYLVRNGQRGVRNRPLRCAVRVGSRVSPFG